MEALIASGGQWCTGRDPQKTPEAAFGRTAVEYLAAALAIQGTNDVRFVKYLSKALRHAANSIDSWAAKEHLHGYALVLMHKLCQEGYPEEALQKTIAKHRYWETEAAAYVAFVQNRPEAAFEKVMDAEDLNEDVQQVEIGSYWLDQIRVLSEGRILELNGDFSAAVDRYASFDQSGEQAEIRESIAQVKQRLDSESPEEARQIASETFGNESLIAVTVRALTDKKVEKGDWCGTLPVALLANQDSTEATLRSLLRLYGASGTLHDRYRPFLRETFERL